MPLNSLKTCLFQHSLNEEGNYSPIDTDAVISDDNYSASGEARFMEDYGSSVGYGKSQSGMAFYKRKKPYPLSKSKIIETGLPIKISPE